MAMVNLITIMGLIGIMVKEIMTMEGLEDLVITILKDLIIEEVVVVVLMVLIVLQMEVLNLREVDGLQKMLMKTGMVLHKIHLQT